MADKQQQMISRLDGRIETLVKQNRALRTNITKRGQEILKETIKKDEDLIVEFEAQIRKVKRRIESSENFLANSGDILEKNLAELEVLQATKKQCEIDSKVAELLLLKEQLEEANADLCTP